MSKITKTVTSGNTNNITFDITGNVAYRVVNNYEAIQAQGRPVRLEFTQMDERRRNMPIKLISLHTEGADLETVSVEIESIGRGRDSVQELLDSISKVYNFSRACSVTRDASAEINVAHFVSGRKRYVISQHSKAFGDFVNESGIRFQRGTWGYEVVTNPMTIDNMGIFLNVVLPALRNFGDFHNERCAFHVHVGMPRNLSMQKNSLSLGLWLDDVLFKIGCVEREFRGNKNNFIYCRPIKHSQVAKADDGYFYKTLNYSGALEAETMIDFWGCFGISNERDQGKYHPSRYTGVNVFAGYLHKTIELRHFGQTFDPVLAMAITSLTQLFAEVSIKANFKDVKSLPHANIEKNSPIKYYVNKLMDFIDLSEQLNCKYVLGKSTVQRLIQAIENSGELRIKDKPVYTHLRNFTLSSEVASKYDLERVKKDDLILPEHVDIHNITQSSILE